jgi:hypothetical protein
MDLNKIQIGLTLAKEINYMKLLINSLLLLADKPNNIEFIIGVDIGYGKGDVDITDLKSHKIIYYDTKLPYSSKAHGVLMDIILHKHFNKKYGMFIDSDVCFLKKGWDTLFINEIENNNLIYLGTASDDPKRRFPGPYCMFFLSSELQNMNYSTQPVQSVYFEKKYDFGDKFEKKILTKNEYSIKGCEFILSKNANIYDLKDGESTYLDTNSQFNIYFKENKKFKIMKCLWPADNEAKFLLNKDDQGNEFHLYNELILTHQGRTHRGWGKDAKNIKWLKQIKNWFNNEELNLLFHNINNYNFNINDQKYNIDQ